MDSNLRPRFYQFQRAYLCSLTLHRSSSTSSIVERKPGIICPLFVDTRMRSPSSENEENNFSVFLREACRAPSSRRAEENYQISFLENKWTSVSFYLRVLPACS